MKIDYVNFSDLNVRKSCMLSFLDWWTFKMEDEIKSYSPTISDLVDHNCISWSSFSECGSYTVSYSPAKNNSTKSMVYSGSTGVFDTETYRIVELYGSRSFSINVSTIGNKILDFRISYRLSRTAHLKTYELTSFIDDEFYSNFQSSKVHKQVMKYLTRILKRSESDLLFLLKSGCRVLRSKYEDELKTGYISSPSNSYKFSMTDEDTVPKTVLGYFQIDFKYFEKSSYYLSRNPDGILVKVIRNICDTKEEVPYLIKSWKDILSMGEDELANLFIEIMKRSFN